MWKPVDTQFYGPRLPVSLVAISGGAEFVRAALEALGCVVLTHYIGTPSDFLRVVAEGENAPRYMIILGHGTKDGLVFGEYEPSDIDTSMLRNGCLPAEVIQKHVHLPGCTIISYSCEGGSDPMARAFLTGGLAAYLGCQTEVDTVALTLFLFHFLFGVREKNLSDRDAWRKAVAAVDHEEINQFRFFRGDGVEERHE